MHISTTQQPDLVVAADLGACRLCKLARRILYCLPATRLGPAAAANLHLSCTMLTDPADYPAVHSSKAASMPSRHMSSNPNDSLTIYGPHLTT